MLSDSRLKGNLKQGGEGSDGQGGGAVPAAVPSRVAEKGLPSGHPERGKGCAVGMGVQGRKVLGRGKQHNGLVGPHASS